MDPYWQVNPRCRSFFTNPRGRILPDESSLRSFFINGDESSLPLVLRKVVYRMNPRCRSFFIVAKPQAAHPYHSSERSEVR